MRIVLPAAARIPLLASMARDFDEVGALRRRTAVQMWAAYGVHAALTARALARPDRHLHVPDTVRPIGVVAVAAGIGLCVAGIGRFSGPAQLEGTRPQALTTGGIYRYSRNPQFLGYLLALAGAATSRRSLTAVTLAAIISLTYAIWIPVEERQLTGAYGQTFENYRVATHRWFGIHRRGRPQSENNRHPWPAQDDPSRTENTEGTR